MGTLTSSHSAEAVLIKEGGILMKYLCSPSGNLLPNTNLELDNSSLTISGRYPFCVIENSSEITIAPSQQMIEKGYDHVEVLCLPGSGGFGFVNVSNLTISSVVFKNCAGDIPASAVRYINDSNQFLRYDHTRAAFLFNHCYNLSLNNLIPHEQDSSAFSIIGANLCGHSSIRIITSNVVPEMKTLLHYTDSLITSSTKCKLHIANNSTLSPSTKFEKHWDYMDIDYRETLSTSSITGWLTLIVAQQNFDADIGMLMKPSIFPKAWTGPKIGILIAFIGGSSDSRITYEGIPHEYCLHGSTTSLGHFMIIPLNVQYRDTSSRKKRKSEVKSSLMIKNTAFVLYTHTEPNSTEKYIKYLLKILWDFTQQEVVMENTTWCMKDFVHNLGHSNVIGSYDYLFTVEGLPAGQLNILSMINTHLQYDHVPPSLQATMQFQDTNATVSGTNYFSVDRGRVMDINRKSHLVITGNFTLSGAYTYNIQGGGGIVLDDSSYLYLKEPLEAGFYNNTAIYGSAIFAPKQCSIKILPDKIYSDHNFTDINIALYFKNNTNHFGVPNSLFTSMFCFIRAEHDEVILCPKSQDFKFDFLDWDQKNSRYKCTSLFDTLFKEMNPFDKFMSLPNGLCWQSHTKEWNCNYTDYLDLKFGSSAFEPHFHTYPGERAIAIKFSYDDVFSVQQVSCSDDTLIILNFDSSVRKMNSTVSLYFKNEEKETVCYLVNRYRSGSVDINFHAYVSAHCPTGFELSEQGYCNCSNAFLKQNYKCDIDSRIFTSPKGYWTGYWHDSNRTIISFTRNCPPNYCDPKFNTFTLNNSITDLSCLNNRTGIICGQCKENYSVVFGSDVCYDNCTDLYLLTLPVYAIAGLILVVLLFALRLTVATGTINGVIFYANILGLSMDQLTRDYHGPYLKYLHIVISLLNLNLGFPLCFYEGMTTTARVGFQFIFPVYLWSIVIGMIIIANHSVRVSNFISKSSVQVLATLFYLSFSKLLRTVIDILSHTTLYSIIYHQHDYSNLSEQTVWYYSGEDYGHGVHGFYLFLATAFVALFLLPYSILITFSYCFMRFKLVNKFKPFIDAYGGPFKDKWRFWFGLRLWITITLFTVSGILQGTNTEIMLTIHHYVILAFLLTQAFCHPYKNIVIRLIDMFFMADYWLIISCTFIFREPSVIQAYIFLLAVAIFVFFLIVVSHCGYRCVSLVNSNVFSLIKQETLRRFNGYEVIRDEADNERANAELFETAERRVLDTY